MTHPTDPARHETLREALERVREFVEVSKRLNSPASNILTRNDAPLTDADLELVLELAENGLCIAPVAHDRRDREPQTEKPITHEALKAARKALLDYDQMDEDGIIVSTSRQAIHEVDQFVGDTLDRIEALEAKVKEQEWILDQVRAQASGWKMEARTQTSIVRDIYQLVTGGTGEPGTWNGARPVKDALTARPDSGLREARVERLEGALTRLGSMEAFTFSFMPDPNRPETAEMNARIEYAREALHEPPAPDSGLRDEDFEPLGADFQKVWDDNMESLLITDDSSPREALAASGGWRPIETAPRDGKCILLFGADISADTVTGSFCNTVGTWDTSEGCFDDGVGMSPEECDGPTHWMPLPEPPAPDTEGSGS